MEVLVLLAVGVGVGVLSGLFGIGGGIVLIPLLVYLLKYPHATANGTSLVALLAPVGILGVVAYYRAGKIGPENVKAGLIIAVGIAAGAYLGAQLALAAPPAVLRKAFGVFLAAVAARFLLG